MSCSNSGLKGEIEIQLWRYFEQAFTFYKFWPVYTTKKTKKTILNLKQLNKECIQVYYCSWILKILCINLLNIIGYSLVKVTTLDLYFNLEHNGIFYIVTNNKINEKRPKKDLKIWILLQKSFPHSSNNFNKFIAVRIDLLTNAVLMFLTQQNNLTISCSN